MPPKSTTQPRPVYSCSYCGATFTHAPSHVGRSSLHYCSRACYKNSTRALASEQLPSRFWSFVDKSHDCWLWQGATSPKGYGLFNVFDNCEFAHRVCYQLISGEPIPVGLLVLHRCDTPACVNPAHLFLGTPADNTRDMLEKGREAKGDSYPDRKGEQNPLSKLTDEKVREIRRRYAKGTVTQKQLSIAFGVSQTTVWHIVSGHSWKHVSN